jgi:aldehyde dehydrogenase (NAD+)
MTSVETESAAARRHEAGAGPRRPSELFALQTANRWEMARTTADERVARLKRLRDAIRQRREALCAAIYADYGKHAVEAELTELMPVMEEIAVAIRHLHRWMRPRRVRSRLTLFGSRSEVLYQAKGLVLVLAPWNYPFQLVINPLVAAVAAGNCVIVRPSDKTPQTSRFLRELVGAVFPECEVAVIVGDRSVADELLELPFDHIFFTGSTAVGRKVMAAASRHLASVTLELGGKSPVIVDDSADIDTAAERIAWGKFINAGQTCVAPDYALVHEAVAERFVSALARAVARFYGEDEAARATSADLACMVDRGACLRLDRAVKETVAAGARLVIGGRVDLFGPVLPILTFRDLDDAIAAVRARPKPLALYVFSTRQANIDTILTSTSAGGTCVNHVVLHLANPHLPFGGVGESGMGHYHGRFGFETMSHARAVYTQSMPSGLRFLFPPYTKRSARMLAALRRIAG